MIKTNNQAGMKKPSYCRPECNVLDIRVEGVLCFSQTGSSADNLTLGEDVTGFTEQIL